MTISDLTRKALEAGARDDSENAIAFLKQAIESDANAAVPRYLLGAEYAQIGLIDRAIAEMGRALDDDPQLAAARFQLGLLLLTSGRIEEAATTWQPLDALGELHPLRLFKAGLLQMVQDRFAEARFLISEALARENSNAALCDDMRMVLARMDGIESQGDEPRGEHILVSAYRGN